MFKYIILGILVVIAILTYFLGCSNPKGALLVQAPKKFFVKNKKILKYFRNPKYGTTKGFAIDHFAQILSLVILLPFYLLYWINGCTAFLLDDILVMMLVFFIFSVCPMLITSIVHARMLSYIFK